MMATNLICYYFRLQLKEPYMGMWIASHSELLKWMRHDFWNKIKSLHADLSLLDIHLGYPERSNGEHHCLSCCCIML